MKRANNFKIVAAIILILTALLWLVKGISDILGGVRGGTDNLVLTVVMFLMALFSWKWRLVGGISTTLLGIVLAVYFNFSLPDIYSAYIPLFLICAPMVLAGLLFIEADWASKIRN